jgi:ferrous iron transport protein B
MTIALAGNANVGKSAIFNQLTKLDQVIGNWPGKTVEKAEGRLRHHGRTVTVLDLPGIYSLSTYSMEELVSREYIAMERPDVVVNVIDATALERNLFLTLQLLEMEVPMVVAFNLTDAAKKKGIDTDYERLEERLGVPVMPTIAIRGIGVHEVVDAAMAVAVERRMPLNAIRYGPEVERRIERLSKMLEGVDTGYSRRWVAIKLLEKDAEVTRIVREKDSRLVEAAEALSDEISRIHVEPCAVVISSERYAKAASIAKDVQTLSKPAKVPMSERLDALSMHPVGGYAFMFAMMLAILALISIFGGWVAGMLETLFEDVNPHMAGVWPEIAWNGGVVGLYAALSVALGFILPFYVIFGLLEDWGYLPRVAYLMDRPCHVMGLHGKACIPLLLGFGCNVPACVGCRIMETKRDRLITMFLSTMVPCSARTAVILGLVGAFVGLQWAVLLYVLDFAIILAVGRALNRLLPGRPVGLIMEMPSYRRPSMRVVLKQAWARFKPFVSFAIPLIVIGSLFIVGLDIAGLLPGISGVFAPVTVLWLGLPAFTAPILIFGILRKEAALALLATVAGTMEISMVMTPVQMIVFSFVIMLYFPCISTFAALVREAGWKNAAFISLVEIGLAVFLGGILYRLLNLLM